MWVQPDQPLCWANIWGAAHETASPQWDTDDVELIRHSPASKTLPTVKKVITDMDLEALIADEFYQPRDV